MGEISQAAPQRKTPVGVHPSAVIDAGATLGKDVAIGPFCHVGGDVVLGDNVELLSHVAVAGRTSIGARTRIFLAEQIREDMRLAAWTRSAPATATRTQH